MTSAASTTPPNSALAPRVGVVVVNHNGGDLTIRCLASLLATEWPAGRLHIVLVDNASADGVVKQVRSELAAVTVVEAAANLGFAAGCNAGIALLDDVDYVGLLNNDATVGSGWLAPLVEALQSAPEAGAAIPKILFDGAFVEIALDSPVRRRGRGDNRPLGVRLSGIRVDDHNAWGAAQMVGGFWGVEHDPATTAPFEWTDGAGRLRVPVRDDGALPRCAVELSADRDCAIAISSGPNRAEYVVSGQPAWYEVPLAGTPFNVINNVGSILLPDGHGADRGYLEPADGNYNEAEEVFAWCGAGVLLSRRYLDEVGGFDEDFFLYYEDLDLSWRGRARGWRHIFVPASVVRHVHSASTVEGSALFDHYVERNRLLTLARNAPAPLATKAALRHLLITASYFRRDVVSPVARGTKPSLETVRRRVRSFAGFARRLPDALVERRQLRSAQSVPDDELIGWARSPARRVTEH